VADDDVQLADLEVVQRYSLALRTATASREDLVAALEADLAWLTGGAPRRRTAARPTARKASARRTREA
jgi:hypothetical protein